MATHITYELDDSDAEDTVEENEMAVEPETSASTIRALLSIVRMLAESSKVQRTVTPDDIQGAAFKGINLTDKEKTVASKIVNFIRPFVRQRMDDNRLPTPHILTCAPLAALANSIAIIAGFPSLARKLSITLEKNSRALHLTAAGLYETVRSQWDIPIGNNNWITSSHQATRSKSVTFGAFFDTKRIRSLMKSYRLEFAWRLVFVDRWTVRLLGMVEPGKTFVKSNYEARRKRGRYVAYPPTTGMTPMSHTDMETEADELAEEVKSLTNALQSLRRELPPLELNRMNIGRDIRKAKMPWDPGSGDCRKLKEVRREVVTKQLEVIRLEKALAKARSSLYSINRALRARPTTAAATSTATNTDAPTAKDDNIESVSTL
jgi:hypothetical protein